MGTDKITFGIATKITSSNRLKYFYKCIDSILDQSNDNFEIIISNDASTIEVDWEKYKKNKNITIYHQEKSLGIFPNFNFCLSKANTKWFIPMGDDDIVNTNFVDEVLKIINYNKEIEVVYFAHDIIDENDNLYTNTKINLVNGLFSYEKSGLQNDNLLWNSPSYFFSVVNVDKLKGIGGYPNYGMTTDGYMAFLYFFKFNGYYTSNPLAKLRRHTENASNFESVIGFMDERSKLLEIILKDFSNLMDENTVKNLNNQKLNIIYHHINLMKQFRDGGRIIGIKFFIKILKHKKFSLKLIIIFFLGLIYGNRIQIGFNNLSRLVNLIYSKIKIYIHN